MSPKLLSIFCAFVLISGCAYQNIATELKGKKEFTKIFDAKKQSIINDMAKKVMIDFPEFLKLDTAFSDIYIGYVYFPKAEIVSNLYFLDKDGHITGVVIVLAHVFYKKYEWRFDNIVIDKVIDYHIN